MLTFDALIRVSRRGKRERLYSPEEQGEDIDRTLASLKAVRGETFEDIDVSGADDRASLAVAVERVEQGLSNGIIVAKWDRLARDNWLGHDIPRRIRKAGGVMLSAAEPFDLESPEGRLQYAQAISFATFFRDRQNVGFERAKQRAIEQGIPIMHRIPAGYRRDRDSNGNPTGPLLADPATASTVAEVFRMRARGKATVDCIAHLEANGVLTGAGSRKWSRTSFYNLLQNRIYLGELSYGGEAGDVRTLKDGSTFPAYVNPSAHEAIIDLDTFRNAQPGSRPVATRGGAKRPAILGGLLRCAGCGYCLKARWEHRHGRIYRCGKTHAAGVCPTPVYVSGGEAAKVEATVEGAFWRIVEERAGRLVAATAERDALVAALEKAERALALYRDDPDLEQTMDDMGGREAWREGLRVRQGRVNDARAELAAVDKSVPVEDARSLRADWEKMSIEDRRERFADAIDCIALTRPNNGDPLTSRVTVFAAGTGPVDLPRRGRAMDGLRPFNLPCPAVAPT